MKSVRLAVTALFAGSFFTNSYIYLDTAHHQLNSNSHMHAHAPAHAKELVAVVVEQNAQKGNPLNG